MRKLRNVSVYVGKWRFVKWKPLGQAQVQRNYVKYLAQ